MNSKILLCTDMDRTIIPNGAEQESPEARPLLRSLATHPDVILAYASGRNQELIREAIEVYDLPVPDFAIGDVGTSLYDIGQEWSVLEDWECRIAGDWNGKNHEDLVRLLSSIQCLELQESRQQNRFKVSYDVSLEMDADALVQNIESLLEQANVQASVIWSVDEEKRIGLVDVLPRRATKNEACRFLIDRLGLSEADTVYAGDSGNDLPALTSGLQAVLVKNAREEVKQKALELTSANMMQSRLYIARGGLFGMNGNYAAGVLEGLVYHIPRAGNFFDPKCFA